MLIRNDKFGIKADLYRKTKKIKRSFFTFFINRDLKCLFVFRKAHYFEVNNKKIRAAFWKIKLKHLCNKYDFNFPSKTDVGYGLFIGHNGPIIINGECIIGNNCNISTGVTIGKENRGKREGCPVIGNKVWIGTNAVIVGKIEIGDNVLIAPNTFVNFSVPSNSIVIGNPAKVISDKNATDRYVTNIVEE